MSIDYLSHPSPNSKAAADSRMYGERGSSTHVGLPDDFPKAADHPDAESHLAAIHQYHADGARKSAVEKYGEAHVANQERVMAALNKTPLFQMQKK